MNTEEIEFLLEPGISVPQCRSDRVRLQQHSSVSIQTSVMVRLQEDDHVKRAVLRAGRGVACADDAVDGPGDARNLSINTRLRPLSIFRQNFPKGANASTCPDGPTATFKHTHIDHGQRLIGLGTVVVISLNYNEYEVQLSLTTVGFSQTYPTL